MISLCLSLGLLCWDVFPQQPEKKLRQPRSGLYCCCLIDLLPATHTSSLLGWLHSIPGALLGRDIPRSCHLHYPLVSGATFTALRQPPLRRSKRIPALYPNATCCPTSVALHDPINTAPFWPWKPVLQGKCLENCHMPLTTWDLACPLQAKGILASGWAGAAATFSKRLFPLSSRQPFFFGLSFFPLNSFGC